MPAGARKDSAWRADASPTPRIRPITSVRIVRHRLSVKITARGRGLSDDHHSDESAAARCAYEMDAGPQASDRAADGVEPHHSGDKRDAILIPAGLTRALLPCHQRKRETVNREPYTASREPQTVYRVPCTVSRRPSAVSRRPPSAVSLCLLDFPTRIGTLRLMVYPASRPPLTKAAMYFRNPHYCTKPVLQGTVHL